MPDGRKGVLEDRLVVPVEVSSREGAAVVTHDDPVRVDHWDHLEDEHVSQQLVKKNRH